MAQYDIFISCKSEDYEIAEKVYSFLKDNGFSVFLSSKELRRMAQADYMNVISVALDTAYSMIVISTQKEYLTSKWVQFEWSTFLNEILSGRKNGQIMTLLENIKVSEMPIQLRKYESFTLENCKDILPYLEKPKKPAEPHESDASEVHIETDIACRVMRFKEELITAQPDDDNLIHLKKGTHKLTFVSLENEQDNYSQVYTVKDECEILQVNLTKIRDARLAKEEAEHRAKEEAERFAEEEERKRIAKDDLNYQKFEVGGKYGFIKDGDVVIPAVYDGVWHFREGIARILKNGKRGYVDKTGKEITLIKYDGVEDFRESFARVKLNGKWGYIDKTGKEIAPIKYDNIEDFSEGMAAVQLNGKWDYIDKTGKEVIPIKCDYAWPFRDGLAMVSLDGKWGFIDKTGREVIPIMYDVVWYFSEGMAKVQLNGKWGYIDKTGKEIASIKYDDVDYFNEDFARVKFNGKWGYIDKTGEEVIPIKFEDAWPFREGFAWVKFNSKMGWIDKQGNFTPEE